MSDIQGALVEPTAVAAYGVDRAGVRPGDTVLITGLGPIGALASLYAAVARGNGLPVGGQPEAPASSRARSMWASCSTRDRPMSRRS